MTKSKRWRNRDDLHEYLDALESVYEVHIELLFYPDKRLPPNEQYLKLEAWWNDGEPHDGVPVCEARYRVKSWPGEEVGPTLLYAATQFTYSVLEAYIAAR